MRLFVVVQKIGRLRRKVTPRRCDLRLHTSWVEIKLENCSLRKPEQPAKQYSQVIQFFIKNKYLLRPTVHGQQMKVICFVHKLRVNASRHTNSNKNNYHVHSSLTKTSICFIAMDKPVILYWPDPLHTSPVRPTLHPNVVYNIWMYIKISLHGSMVFSKKSRIKFKSRHLKTNKNLENFSSCWWQSPKNLTKILLTTLKVIP